MGFIQQKIMEQMQQIGKPRKITQTTTQNVPEEGVDIGQLGMLLSLLFMLKDMNKTTKTPSSTSIAGLGSMGTGKTNLNPMQIMQMLLSLGGGTTSSAGF